MTALTEVVAGDGDGKLCERTSVVLGDPHGVKMNESSVSPPPSSSHTPIAAASYFDALAEEEVVEILRRLPLKLATQCKSVSKNWLSLISSTHFARSYLRSLNEPLQFTLINRYLSIIGPGLFRETPSSSDAVVELIRPEDIILHEDTIPYQITVDLQFLAASNGWVLCSYPDRSGEIYFVVNPLTQHLITLPPILRSSDNFCRVGFVFIDPYDSNRETSSFRVVRFPPTDEIPDNKANTMKFDIFSSETGQWTQSTLSFSSQCSAKRSDRYDCSLNYHAIAFNGKLHWLHVWFASEIFVYDPYEPERYQRLSLPEDCAGADRFCLGTFQGQARRKHLKYVEWSDGVVRVWELKDYDKVEWRLLHSVRVLEITSRVSTTLGLCWPPRLRSAVFHPDVVAIHPWDRDLVLCRYDTRFLQYNLRLKTLEALLDERQEEIKVDTGILTEAFFLFELPWWPTPVPPPSSN